jgi:hypothetical protein
MTDIIKSIILRFIRAFVAGAVATMIIIVPLSSGRWEDLGTWLSSLALAGIIGGISGVLQATDKWIRS